MQRVHALALVGLAGCGVFAGQDWYKQYGIKNEAELTYVKSVPALTRAVQRGDCSDAYRAVEALEAIGGREVGKPLTMAIQNKECASRSWNVRVRAINAMGNLAYAEFVKPLTQLLNDTDGEVVSAALNSLTQIADARPEAEMPSAELLDLVYNDGPTRDARWKAEELKRKLKFKQLTDKAPPKKMPKEQTAEDKTSE